MLKMVEGGGVVLFLAGEMGEGHEQWERVKGENSEELKDIERRERVHASIRKKTKVFRALETLLTVIK